jgi:hypothetical protein
MKLLGAAKCQGNDFQGARVTIPYTEESEYQAGTRTEWFSGLGRVHADNRGVQTGTGTVQVPRVRDRRGTGIQFRSAILPPYIRRSKSLDALLPWLY